MQTLYLPKGERDLTPVVGALSSLSRDTAWELTFKERKGTRSVQQNRYLWGVCYPAVLKHLPGWDAEDLHEYFLGEAFGWETLQAFGRKRLRPIRRSSKLNKMEFVDFVDFIQWKAAELGIVIPEAGALSDGW